MAKNGFVNLQPGELPAVPHNVFQPSDRRENPRKNFEARIIVHPHITPDFHVGWIQNISIGGFRLKTEVQPPPLTKQEEVGFHSDIGPLTLVGKGRVIWTSDIENEVGIKFTQFADETGKSIQEFLNW